MGILLAVANRKGGVGKSTITTMLAHGFAAIGEQRVLVVDLDTQCNSSMILTGGEKWDFGAPQPQDHRRVFRPEIRQAEAQARRLHHQQCWRYRSAAAALSVLSGSLDLEDVENAFPAQPGQGRPGLRNRRAGRDLADRATC